MSSPGPDRAASARSAAIGACLLAAAVAWLSLPDRTFVYDGLIFAQTVERSIDDWRSEFLNPRHLLFNAFFQILRDALIRCGVTVGAYRLFQVVNAAAGAAGLWLFGDLCRRLSRSEALGWLAALILGATWCYGTRATEGQVYMLMSVGALATAWSCVRLLGEPSPGRAGAAAAAYAVASLLHAANAFLFPAVAAAMWFAFGGRRAVAGAGAALVALVAPYLLIFSGAGLRGFLGGATDYRATTGGFWSGLFAKFWGDLSPAARLVAVWRETGAALLPFPEGFATVVGLSWWLAVLGGAWAVWPLWERRERERAAVIAAAWAGYTIVNMYWPGGLFFYSPPHAFALALGALAAGTAWPRVPADLKRKVLGGVAAVGVFLAAWNFREGLIPQSRIENNAGYRRAVWVGEHTVPSAWIVVSGFGFPNSKIYLTNFAHRTREVLEFYFDRRPKDEALRTLSVFTGRLAALGVPMYLLSDLIESPSPASEMTRLWSVSLGEIQNAFGPGRILRVAASGEERVYLFLPKGREPELFVGLGYSVLSESSGGRLAETAGALKEIAKLMTPEERRRAANLMRDRNFGFDILMEGFAPVMSAESRAAAAGRLKNFDDYQKTPDFWLRAGNLYKMLDLKAEAAAAWTKAQKLSGDASLLKDIEALRKSK